MGVKVDVHEMVADGAVEVLFSSTKVNRKVLQNHDVLRIQPMDHMHLCNIHHEVGHGVALEVVHEEEDHEDLFRVIPRHGKSIHDEVAHGG